MGGIISGLQLGCLPKPAILLDEKLKFICFLETPIKAMQVRLDHPNHAIIEAKNFHGYDQENQNPPPAVPIADNVHIRDGTVYVLYRIPTAEKPPEETEEERTERELESLIKDMQEKAEVGRLRSILREKRRGARSVFVAGGLEVIPEEDELRLADDYEDKKIAHLRVLWD